MSETKERLEQAVQKLRALTKAAQAIQAESEARAVLPESQTTPGQTTTSKNGQSPEKR